MTEYLKQEDVGGGVLVLTLSKAPVNALNPKFLTLLTQLFGEIDRDPNVRALVITSDLAVFSAGMDLKEAQRFSVDEQTAAVDGLNSSFARLYGLSKPVITAANGAAIAGGLFFLLSADYALAVEHGKFGLTEVRVGIDFPVGPLEIARAALTPAAFRRMLLTGRNFDAATAEAMGFVDEVTTTDDLMPRALAVARDYAAIPPVAFGKIKAQMRASTLAIVNTAIAAQSDPARGGWFTEETATSMSNLLAMATKKR